MEGDIKHVGVIGMKWKHHKTREAELKTKLGKITKDKSLNGTSDQKRFEYRNQSLAKRVGKSAVGPITSILLRDFMTGQLTPSVYTNKNELRKRMVKIAKSTAATVALNDVLASSAARKYNAKGQKIKGSKDPLMTREDLVVKGILQFIKVAPVLGMVLQLKASSIAKQRRKNEEAFAKWGGNILTEKVDNILWKSADGQTILR